MRPAWRSARLGDLVAVQNGFAFDSKLFGSEGMPLIRIRDLKAGDRTETSYSGEFDRRYIVRAGDLLVGMDGEFRCYEWRGTDALLNQRVCRLQDFDGALNPKFLYYGINRYLQAIEDVTAFATVKHLSSRQILDIEMPLPSRAEQRRIVAFLDEAFASIAAARANAKKNLRNANELFNGLRTAAFNVAGWSERPFEGCIEDVIYTSKVQRKQFLDEGEYPVISQEEAFINGYWNNARDVFKVDRPLVLFGDHTKALKYIDCDFVLGADGVKILKPKPFLHPRFFYHQLRTAKLESLGYARHYKLLKELTVRYPPLDEQQRIAAELDNADEQAEQLQSTYTRKLAALDELKQSLLHQAFSGQL